MPNTAKRLIHFPHYSLGSRQDNLRHTDAVACVAAQEPGFSGEFQPVLAGGNQGPHHFGEQVVPGQPLGSLEVRIKAKIQQRGQLLQHGGVVFTRHAGE